ncbi:MAG: FAD binding domain-containing protein [Gaiellales bacterium]
MIPSAFDYERPQTVSDAVSLLQRHGDGARVLAGGHSLLPMMKLRLAAPDVLVDIGGISSLRGIRESEGGIALGALTRHSEVAASEIVRRGCPILASAAAGIGDMQVRARGTIGGSIANADPHGDMPAVLLALEGEVMAEGPNGARTIPASDLFVDYLTTSLSPDEILTEVRVPTGVRGAYVKFHRRAQDWAVVGVAAVLAGSSARIAITGVGTTPVRATAAEQAYASGGAEAAAAAAGEGLSPMADLAGSAEYRVHLARVLTRRALEQASA